MDPEVFKKWAREPKETAKKAKPNMTIDKLSSYEIDAFFNALEKHAALPTLKGVMKYLGNRSSKFARAKALRDKNLAAIPKDYLARFGADPMKTTRINRAERLTDIMRKLDADKLSNIRRGVSV